MNNIENKDSWMYLLTLTKERVLEEKKDRCLCVRYFVVK